MRHWWLFLLLAGALASCNLVAQSEQDAPRNAPNGDGGGTETYTNTTVGYAFDFPAGWHLVADDPGFVQLWSVDPASVQGEAGFENIEGDFVVIGFLAEEESEPLSLDALAERYEQAVTSGGATVTSSREVELASGLRAVEIEASDGAFVLLTLVNGRGLHIDSFGSADLFYTVVDTLREVPIEASSPLTV